MTTPALAPVTGRARIDVLDILRGIAILGIFFMNIPYMGQNSILVQENIRAIGWTLADRWTWAVIEVLAEGTQRGLLEMLFGAGMMVLTTKAMLPDGPVAIADLYYRRNLWLLAFGLFDVFCLLWVGDILHIYALAALFLFPFRKLAAHWLVVIGMSFALATVAMGAGEYLDRSAMIAKVERAQARQHAGQPLSVPDRETLKTWQTKLESIRGNDAQKKAAQEEDAARRPGASFIAYASLMWSEWFGLQSKGFTVAFVIEAFCAMLIGVALWKWQIMQGGAQHRFLSRHDAAQLWYRHDDPGDRGNRDFRLCAHPQDDLDDRRVWSAGDDAGAYRAGEPGGENSDRDRDPGTIQGSGADGLLPLLHAAVPGALCPVRALRPGPVRQVRLGRAVRHCRRDSDRPAHFRKHLYAGVRGRTT